MKNRAQVQNATAGFILNKYTKFRGVLELKWLRIEEIIELSTLTLNIDIFRSELNMTNNFQNIYIYSESGPT